MTASIEVQPDHLSLSFASDDPAEHLDIETALRDLKELREIRAALADWECLLTEWTDAYLGRNTLTVQGIGTALVKHGKKRKEWDTRELLRAVLDSRLPPTDDGEVHPFDDGEADVKGETIHVSPDAARILHVWNLGEPRVTALKERGIPVDEYCSATAGKVTVVIE